MRQPKQAMESKPRSEDIPHAKSTDAPESIRDGNLQTKEPTPHPLMHFWSHYARPAPFPECHQLDADPPRSAVVRYSATEGM